MLRKVAAGLALTCVPGLAMAADAKRESFGALSDGTAVEAVTLTNGKGMSARVITLGAILHSLKVPDRNGVADEVTLGYDTAAEYLAKPNYFGASIGRYGNRIKDGKFSLDGRSYQLETNNNTNHLHGGVTGFDKKMWTVDSMKNGLEASVTMRYVSADGEGGYPGQLTVLATYSLNESNELKVSYRATTTKPTVVNLTNHAFFNMAGESAKTDILDQKLTLHASRMTPVDATLIPTGQLRPVEGTPFDFRTPTAIGANIRDGRDEQLVIGQGFDHNFVIDGAAGKLRPAARLEDPVSGRVMDLLVAAPAVQVYTGNFLDGSIVGRGGRVYRQSDGICLEPQTYPDAPNQPSFPSARLDPGQTYDNSFVFRFSISK